MASYQGQQDAILRKWLHWLSSYIKNIKKKYQQVIFLITYHCKSKVRLNTPYSLDTQSM